MSFTATCCPNWAPNSMYTANTAIDRLPDPAPQHPDRNLRYHPRRQAVNLSYPLVQRNLIPDLILVSPAERTWAIAAMVAATSELDAKQVQCARELYLATSETAWRLLCSRDRGSRHLLI